MPSVCLLLLPVRLNLKQLLLLNIIMASTAMDMVILATMDMDMVTMVTMARGPPMLNLIMVMDMVIWDTMDMVMDIMDMDTIKA